MNARKHGKQFDDRYRTLDASAERDGGGRFVQLRSTYATTHGAEALWKNCRVLARSVKLPSQ
jgi:hypothetical protein